MEGGPFNEKKVLKASATAAEVLDLRGKKLKYILYKSVIKSPCVCPLLEVGK
jgi:hypothetical protein